jgi:hypothetical protein
MTTKPAELKKQPTQEEVERLVALLFPGIDRAIFGADLCLQLGWKDTESNHRKIRWLAEHAPLYGYLVCSGDDGYWLYTEPGDDGPMRNRINSQIARMARRLRWFDAALVASHTQGKLL